MMDEKTEKRYRKLIAQARDFRAGSKNKGYLEVALADALERVLDENEGSK